MIPTPRTLAHAVVSLLVRPNHLSRGLLGCRLWCRLWLLRYHLLLLRCCLVPCRLLLQLLLRAV